MDIEDDEISRLVKEAMGDGPRAERVIKVIREQDGGSPAMGAMMARIMVAFAGADEEAAKERAAWIREREESVNQFMEENETPERCERFEVTTQCRATEGLEYVEDDGWYCKPHANEARAEYAEEEARDRRGW